MTAKVIPMPKKPTSPAKINPPEGWKDGEGFVRMYGHDAQGQPSPLVRLADLALWLEFRDLLPVGGGAKAIDRALPGDALAWVYWLANKDATGELVPSACTFGQYTSEQAARAAVESLEASRVRRILSKGLDFDVPSSFANRSKRELLPAVALRFKVVESGMPALRALLEQIALKDPYTLSQVGGVWDALAIPREKAHALWGWGAVDSEGEAGETGTSELPATWKELVAYHKKNPGHSWTYDMQRIATKEEVRRNSLGFTGVRKAMASELGMSDKGLGEHIRKGAADGNKSGRGRKRAG